MAATVLLHGNIRSIKSLLDMPTINELSKLNRKRWNMAFQVIYCSRAFFTPKKSKASPPPSYRLLAIDVEHQKHSYFPNIHQATLTHLVKEKKLDSLLKFKGVEGVASSVKTDLNCGISADVEDIQRRQEAFGENTFRKPPAKSFLRFVYQALKDSTILILLVCARLYLGFDKKEDGTKEGWYDRGSIFVAVFLVISVSAISNFRQSRQFDKLSKVSNNLQVEVVRNGRRKYVSIFKAVVGDVVCLKIGDQVPADGLFIDGHSLTVDESSMTGESDYVQVNRADNPFLFSGTKVADGYARMLVTSVGMNTTWGQMMSTISIDTDKLTPLQERLNKLTSSISKVGLLVAFLVNVVLLIQYFMGNTEDANGNTEFRGGKTKVDDVINAVMGVIFAAVTIVLVAIPEGLALSVTLTLAYSMKRMMADQALVRKLSACETMGSATIICTDKTGTLTMNKMKVTKFWVGQDSMEEISYTSISVNFLELIHQGVGLNTTGNVYKPASGSEFEFSGSPTEKAILSFAVLELNMDFEELKQSCTLLKMEAFNSEKKRSGILMKKNLDNAVHVHWKGAAETILAMCCTAASSLRCIAFAHKQVSQDEQPHQNIDDKSLTLVGLVGLKDPCRPGTKKAVEDCQYAGVNIKMITGDNVFTAKAIATECGILKLNQDNNNGEVVEGEQFRNYTHKERTEKIDKIHVMARSSPFDKLLMVQCLKQKGHVVAVTGDGTNDAPALKEANIGLSMGIQGTEVAKESSDIVILDDNFASVASVLRWGRCIYNNIQKFIQFQLTANVAALTINFVTAVSAGEVPLTMVQLLWVNIIMDTLGALALAIEKPTKELMEKKPVGQSEPLITNIMWRNIIAQSFYQIIVLLTLQFEGKEIFSVNERVKDTLIFNTFVLCQVFNKFNARKSEKKNIFEGIHKNKLFVGITGVTIILQVVMVEFLKKFADTERLNWGQWGACIGLASMSWPIGFLVKYVPVPEKPFFSFSQLTELEI
ncbi:hypothetical protein LguiA_030987 [Lonicera macranthoides]